MANEMPNPADYTGLTRVVLQYADAFKTISDKAKTGPLTDDDWAQIEQHVDVDSFVREGVFLGLVAEVLNWPTYKRYVVDYSGDTLWEGTLRNVTETPGRVILELEERNHTRDVIHVANTVTIYEFNEAGKLRHLDVYVSPLPR